MTMNTKKIIKIIGTSVALFAAAYFAFVVYSLPKTASAASGAPTVTFIPSYDTSNWGAGTQNINGGQLKISGSGPFNQDFRVELCLQDARGAVGTQCLWTPWASAAAPAGTSQISDSHNVPEYNSSNAATWWSPWGGSGGSGPWLIPSGIPAITVQTRSLPAGEVVNNVQLGIQFIEYNSSNPGIGAQCLHQIGGNGSLPQYPGDSGLPPNVIAHPDGAEFTPIGGGVSAVTNPGAFGYASYPPGFAYGWTNGNCGDPAALSDTPNYFRIYMSGGSYNASGASNNIPASTNVSQNVTTGTNGSPVEITVTNTGGSAWVSDQSTPIAGTQSGTCNGTGGTQPSASDPQGTSCTVSMNNYSDVFELQHISGSFTVGSNPAQYSQVTQRTCTVGPAACSNSACTTQSSCTSLGSCPGPNTGSFGQTCQSPTSCSSPGCGGNWINGCNATWSSQIQCTVSGNPNIAPGATAVFKLNSLTAPSTAGLYTETWQMLSKGSGNFGSPISKTIQVGAPANGTIAVASENSQTHGPLTAQWLLEANTAQDNPCGASWCAPATNATYQNVAIDTYTLQINNAATPSGYVLRSVRQVPIASRLPNWLDTVLSFGKGIVSPDALAYTYCGMINATPTSCPNNVGSLTMPNGGGSINYVILWDPIATMGISQNTWSPTAASNGVAVTQPVTITNTGAPGSTLTWTASSNASWLSVSPASDNTGLTNGASGKASENVTITANPAGLSLGQHTGTISFFGTSHPGAGSPTQTLTVTFTVTGSGGAGYSCSSNACVSVGSGAQYATVGQCDTACGFSGSVSGVTVTCNPSSIYTNGTSTCSAIVGGAGGYSSAVTWSASAGTITAAGGYTAPGSAGMTTIMATSKQDPTKSGSTLVTVSTPPPPACTSASCQATCNPVLTASPSSIVVPESSSLSYSCSHVTECQLTGGDLTGSAPIYASPSPGNISGTATTTPSVTTTYTLTCVNSNYSSDSVNSTVQVTVGGSGLCEQNPNGAGCPGAQ